MRIFAAGNVNFYTNKYPAFKSRDFLELPTNDVIKKVKASVNSKNYIGGGCEADVYKIKNTKYCVRIPHVSEDVFCAEYNKELSDIDRVNHVKAKLGFGSAILEFFEGVTPSKYRDCEKKRYKFQEKIAKMPNKSYTELLHQISNAIDNEMAFDCAGGNLIVNTLKKKLTAIDFYGIPVDNPRPIRPLCEMYSILTLYGAQPKTSQKIAQKIILSSLKEFEPNKIPCMDLSLFDYEELIAKLERQGLCTKTEKLKTLITDLKNIKKKEIIDKTISPLLEYKIKRVQKLIRTIL